jgi:hypothetical protein
MGLFSGVECWCDSLLIDHPSNLRVAAVMCRQKVAGIGENGRNHAQHAPSDGSPADICEQLSATAIQAVGWLLFPQAICSGCRARHPWSGRNVRTG